jgi:hypothetical protein
VILLFLTSVALIELARRLPVFAALGAMSACSAQAMRLLRRGGSDWSKERAMRILARRLFLRSLHAGGMILLVASPLLALLLVDALVPAPAGLHLDDWGVRLWVLPFTLGYAMLRWRIGRIVQPR